MKTYKVVVAGATGVVGREVLKILAERKFPYSGVVALASKKSVGKTVSFGKIKLKIKDLEKFDFKGFDLALFCIPTSIAKKYAEKATKAGCIVIDNSTHYRTEPKVPVLIPEVNPEAAKLVRKKKIVANSNCAAIAMLVAIKPLHEKVKIKRIVVATYQSVSGWGWDAMQELDKQTKEIISKKKAKVKILPRQIGFNVIPQIDKFMDDGRTVEEWKIAHDTAKILDPKIKVVATCVRVPVFLGHAESLNLEFKKPISEKEVRKILSKAKGIKIIDERKAGGYATPIEAAGKDAVYVSRIRKDPTRKNTICLWVVSDNIRKGAALNTVQIAEELIKQKLL